MTKVILHAGWSKTGSTALQYFLFHNRALLLKQNILYADIFSHELDTNHNWIADSLLTHPEPGDVDTAILNKRAPWDELKAQINTHNPKTVILSGEAFSWVMHYQFESFYTAVKEFDMELIIYHRCPVQFAESIYNQSIKTGFYELPHTFLASNREYKARIHADELYQKIVKYFGKNKFILRPYLKSLLHDNSIINDFAKLTDIKLDDLTMPLENINSPIPESYIELCRYINASIKNPVQAREKIQLLMNYVLQYKDNPKQKSILSQETISQILNDNLTKEKRIANAFFDKKTAELFINALHSSKENSSQDEYELSLENMRKEVVIPLLNSLTELHHIVVNLSESLKQQPSTPTNIAPKLSGKIKRFFQQFFLKSKHQKT